MTRDRVLVTERQFCGRGDTIYHRPVGTDRTLCGLRTANLLFVPLADLEDPRECDHCRNGGTSNARNSSTLAHRLSELDPDAVGDDRARPDGGVFCGPGDDPAVLDEDRDDDEDPVIRPDGSGYAGDLTDHHFLLTCGECGVLDSAHTGTRLFRDVRVAYRRAGIHEGLSGDDHRVDVESVEPATDGGVGVNGSSANL